METQTTQPAPALLPPSMAPLDERLRHFALVIYVEAYHASRVTEMTAGRIMDIAQCLELPEPQWNGSEWMIE